MERYRSGHNGTDSKSVDGQPSVGSNPTRSAIKALKACAFRAFSYQNVLAVVMPIELDAPFF